MAGKKDGKVSVSIFLNKKLKPLENKAGIQYPVYFRINYNRNNTQFPALIDQWGLASLGEKYSSYFSRDRNTLLMLEDRYATEELFEKHQEGLEYFRTNDPRKENSLLTTRSLYIAEKVILKVAEYERDTLKENFELAGIGKRVELFFKGVVDELGEELTVELRNYLKKRGANYLSRQIKSSNPFFLNFDIANSNSRSDVKGYYPKALMQKIEAFFVIAASAQYNKQLNSFYNWKFEEMQRELEDYLNDSDIFNEDALLKVPLKNIVSRHISLYPPSNPMDYYIWYFKRYVDRKIEENLKMNG